MVSERKTTEMPRYLCFFVDENNTIAETIPVRFQSTQKAIDQAEHLLGEHVSAAGIEVRKGGRLIAKLWRIRARPVFLERRSQEPAASRSASEQLGRPSPPDDPNSSVGRSITPAWDLSSSLSATAKLPAMLGKMSPRASKAKQRDFSEAGCLEQFLSSMSLAASQPKRTPQQPDDYTVERLRTFERAAEAIQALRAIRLRKLRHQDSAGSSRQKSP